MLIRTDGKLHARCDMVLVENLEGSLADVTIAKDLDNGSVGVLGDYSAVEREVRAFSAPAGTETKNDLLYTTTLTKNNSISVKHGKKDLYVLSCRPSEEILKPRHKKAFQNHHFRHSFCCCLG